MKKGVLDMLVLKLLSSREKYGYQIISELKENGDGRFDLKEGTLYPILYRLEDDGMIVSRWSEVRDRKVPRKYYCITPKGKQMLSEIEALWRGICCSAEKIMEDGSCE